MGYADLPFNSFIDEPLNALSCLIPIFLIQKINVYTLMILINLVIAFARHADVSNYYYEYMDGVSLISPLLLYIWQNGSEYMMYGSMALGVVYVIPKKKADPQFSLDSIIAAIMIILAVFIAYSKGIKMRIGLIILAMFVRQTKSVFSHALWHLLAGWFFVRVAEQIG